jgi:hypothetical protein
MGRVGVGYIEKIKCLGWGHVPRIFDGVGLWGVKGWIFCPPPLHFKVSEQYTRRINKMYQQWAFGAHMKNISADRALNYPTITQPITQRPV